LSCQQSLHWSWEDGVRVKSLPQELFGVGGAGAGGAVKGLRWALLKDPQNLTGGQSAALEWAVEPN
jgi:hypothetical protein